MITSKKLKVSQSEDSITITFKWFSSQAYLLFFVMTIWNSFLFIWYDISFNSLFEGDTVVSYGKLVFPIGHVAIGILGTYYTLCLFLNKTEVSVEDDTLKVRHSPLPWGGQLTLDAEDIEQLYVKEFVHNTKNGSSSNYPLYLKKTNGENIILIGGNFFMDEFKEVKQIEKLLERHLHIEDYAMPEEFDSQS
ncbi:hypothetical protein [Flammeovirga aprica]|uniref:Uncharacterized protein n=1 Tax=Flammeovirga aprica JL-4 TaxID=694437 RepID=A0A7X9RWK9_9BACT|nr:hypothetical protein [Flammeovirga aprica]NME70056.1 hypothetical protein [Flammeovirga aprica JL-4]